MIIECTRTGLSVMSVCCSGLGSIVGFIFNKGGTLSFGCIWGSNFERRSSVGRWGLPFVGRFRLKHKLQKGNPPTDIYVTSAELASTRYFRARITKRGNRNAGFEETERKIFFVSSEETILHQLAEDANHVTHLPNTSCQ